MNSTYLFKLSYGQNMLDLTGNIVVPSYKMNQKPVYTEWQDGNMKNRRDIHRYRISGSFTLLFTSISEYETFITAYEAAHDDYSGDGSVTAYMYVNNTDKIETRQVYMEFELADEMPLMGVTELDGIEVTIEEL